MNQEVNHINQDSNCQHERRDQTHNKYLFENGHTLELKDRTIYLQLQHTISQVQRNKTNQRVARYKTEDNRNI